MTNKLNTASIDISPISDGLNMTEKQEIEINIMIDIHLDAANIFNNFSNEVLSSFESLFAIVVNILILV